MPTLKSLREQRALSQETLAYLSGVTQKTIIRLEKGENIPQKRTLRQIARALKVKPTDIEFSIVQK